MKRLVCAAVALGMVVFAANGALAAAEVTMERTEINDNKTSTDVMYLAPDAMKIDMTHRAMVFRSSDNAILMMDKEKHTYFDMGDMAKRMQAMQAKLQALPEAQRKMVEGMMSKQQDAPPPTYTHTGSKTVNGWPCEVYHVSDEMMQREECIAKLKDVGVTDADIAALKSFSQSMQNSMPPAMRGRTSGMDFDAQTKAVGYPGVPVETTILSDGKPSHTTVVKSVTHDPIPAGTFDVPAGYTQQKGGPMGGGGGGDD